MSFATFVRSLQRPMLSQFPSSNHEPTRSLPAIQQLLAIIPVVCKTQYILFTCISKYMYMYIDMHIYIDRMYKWLQKLIHEDHAHAVLPWKPVRADIRDWALYRIAEKHNASSWLSTQQQCPCLTQVSPNSGECGIPSQRLSDCIATMKACHAIFKQCLHDYTVLCR